MAGGKNLLDAAAILKASHAILQKYAALRSQQWEHYTRTSSLARVVQDQTDRVLVTARAAGYLSKRLLSDTAEARARGLDDRPERRGPLAPEAARRLQRQSEFQIPARPAETKSNESSDADAKQLSKGHDEDVFYARAKNTSPALSELPRTKIPKHTGNAQETDEHVKDGPINSDVFYSSRKDRADQELPLTQASPQQEQLPEGVNTDVFYSPKISKQLCGEGGGSLRLKTAAGAPVEKTVMAEGKNQDTVNVRLSQEERVTVPEMAVNGDHQEGTRDVEDLAADIAQDLNNAPSSEISANVTPRSTSQMHESRVPASQFGRLWHYSGLATGMAFGAISESLRRATGSSSTDGSLMMSAGNMDRLVAKLSRMRGAALKLGQMISFQDAKMLPAPISEVLQRVQDSADYMPVWQRDKVLASNLGSDWRDLFSEFEKVPMAAASIGQVHRAVWRSSGQRVAVKVQYPGVANSIDSDLNNLSILLTASRLLPKGLYLEKTIANARTELGWECDYVREAECARKFQRLLADDQEVFVVPEIIEEGSGKEVLTMEYMEGVGVTKALGGLSQEEKDWIGTQILRLCLREVMEFQFMQTDPNWTNFLYNRETRKIELLDFGASRAYPREFIQAYILLLHAGSMRDREGCIRFSIQLGYLTGHESRKMLEAHVESIFVLAEPFQNNDPEHEHEQEGYDFSNQTITTRVKALIPIMLRERLKSPPEETYSLHRKLSGAFLLCARLGSRVRCRELFARAYRASGVVVDRVIE